MVETVLVDARKKDAELLDERCAFDLEWLQQDHAAKRADEGAKQMTEKEYTTAAAGESPSY